MVQHMMKNMILSCCPVVLCKLGQKSDMKNGDFLPYFYPLFHIQYRFCGPRVNLRLAYELAKTIPIDFSHSAPVVGIKKAKNHRFPLGLMKQKSCHKRLCPFVGPSVGRPIGCLYLGLNSLCSFNI